MRFLLATLIALAALAQTAQAVTITYTRTDFPSGRPPERQMAPRASDVDTFEEVFSNGNALQVYEKSGYVDTANGAARVEKCQCDYETVAASQTDQVLGVTGGTGDYLERLIIVPATTSPGVVQIKDGSGSAITVFTGGATSVSNLAPIPIEFNWTSTGGAWKVTTGANVSVLAGGRFTP